MQNKYIAAVLAILLLAVLCNGLLRQNGQQGNVQTKETIQSLDEEQKLSQILSGIDGAGQVQVMITYASGPEIVPASVSSVNTSQQDAAYTSSSRTEPASAQDGAIVLKELSPQIKGVVVIAEGADDVAVKLDLLQATVTVLQIDADQVDVFTMQK